MQTNITTEKVMNLIRRYYESINANGYLNDINHIFNNTVESHVIVDEILEPVAINNNYRKCDTDKDIYHLTGRLILPYNLYCRVNNSSNAISN